MSEANPRFQWARFGGFECSSKGDKRFSALYAKLPDGRTIEEHYQCDVKGYQPGGRDWRLGKGKPPLDPSTDLWKEYLGLWQIWAAAHPELMDELRAQVSLKNYTLSDRFASTPISQARALAEILNMAPEILLHPMVEPASRADSQAPARRSLFRVPRG